MPQELTEKYRLERIVELLDLIDLQRMNHPDYMREQEATLMKREVSCYTDAEGKES